MATLETILMIRVNKTNAFHYEKIGYYIPKYIDKEGIERIPQGHKIMITVDDLPENSGVKLYKICDICGKLNDKPQRYQAIFMSRQKPNANGRDFCLKCANINIKINMVVPKEKSLAEHSPYLISEWHPTLNSKNPNEVFYGSRKKHWWQCPNVKDHVYDMTINNRTNHSQKCPYCANMRVNHTNCLATTHPEMAKQWHPTKNGKLTPYDVTKHSSKLVWWLCEKGHEWETKIGSREDNSNCRKCYLESIDGENNPNWKGGISPIVEFLRIRLKQWKRDSMKNCNYKCIITGDKKWNDIHHLYSFESIMKKTFKEVNLHIRDKLEDYNEKELQLLSEKCLEIHYRYPLGICLRRDIHMLFHNLYGRFRNTPEQFEEFKLRWRMGEFENISEDNNIA